MYYRPKNALYLLPPLVLTVVFYFYFQFQNLSLLTPIFQCGGNQSAVVGDHAVDRLRASVTFLPLKDTREQSETWFISTVNDTSEPEGEAKNLVFPSAASSGRLLCMLAPSHHNGAKNAYALAWRDALPRGAELRRGLAFVSETFYDHGNLWHGISAIVPFASWHERSGCRARPARWALFHHGEVRTGMSTWVASLAEAATGAEVTVEVFNSNGRPVCFEEAVVFRRNLAGLSKERTWRAFDFMRCKARAHCGVDASSIAGVTTGSPAVRVTILLRTGARAFKDEAAVLRVFQTECARVAGCVVTTARSDNLTFCDQVRLLSGTDVLISAHGAQMTNLMFMDENSSIMEFYPMGWKERAGGGQFVFRWMAEWARMRHEGSWWDADGDGEPCPGSDDIYSCFKSRKIGLNETYFAQWAAKVFAAAKERRAGGAGEASAEAPRRAAAKNCQCV